MTAKEYNELVSQHADGLYRFILKMLRDEAAAQDVVQDSFEKLWLNREKVESTSAKSWLFSTAHNAAIDALRKSSKQAVLDEHIAENMLYYSQEYDGTRELLDLGLEKLPAVQRSAILLRDYEGYSYAEIGGITGLSESQVKVYIHRARMFLRTFIEKMESYHNAD